MAVTEHEHHEFSEEIGEIANKLQDSANAKTVYGEAVDRDDRTVIPVARVAYGFGGGFGEQADGGETEPSGGGGGFGGGAMAKPVGAIEITDDDTRFVPLGSSRRTMIVVGAFLAGLVVGGLVRRLGGD